MKKKQEASSIFLNKNKRKLGFSALVLIFSISISAQAVEISCGQNSQATGNCYGDYQDNGSDGNANASAPNASYSSTKVQEVYGAAANKAGGTGNSIASGTLTMNSASAAINKASGANAVNNSPVGEKAEVTSGTLIMNSGSKLISGEASGADASSDYSDAIANQGSLTATGASINGFAFGAKAKASIKSGNGQATATGTTNLSQSTTVGNGAYGAYAEGNNGANATGTLKVDNSTLSGNYNYGAYALSHKEAFQAYANGDVTLSNNSDVSGETFGAYAQGMSAKASGNLIVKDSTVGNINGAGTYIEEQSNGEASSIAFLEVDNSTIGDTIGAYALISDSGSTGDAIVTLSNFIGNKANFGNLSGVSLTNSGKGDATALAKMNLSDSSVRSLYGIQIKSGVNSSGNAELNLDNTTISYKSYGTSVIGQNSASATSTFTLNNSKLGGDFYSSYAYAPSATTKANFTLTNSEVNGNLFVAYSQAHNTNAKADSTISIDKLTKVKNIQGSYASSLNSQATATLNLSNSIVEGHVYGAHSTTQMDAVINNQATVNINGSQITSQVIAATSEEASGTNKSVISSGKLCIGENCVSGKTTQALTNNFDSIVKSDVYASFIGSAEEKAQADSTLVIANSSIGNPKSPNNVAGSYVNASDGDNLARNSEFVIKNASEINANIYAAYINAAVANAEANTVYIYDGVKVNGDINGAYAYNEGGQNSTASVATLAIANTNSSQDKNIIQGNVYGAYAQAGQDASATIKEMYLANSTFTSTSSGDNISAAYALSDGGNAIASLDNNLTMTGIEADGTISLVYAQNEVKGSASASANNIYIESSKIGDASKESYLYGTYAQAKKGDVEASTNSFRILNGSTVDANIYGAYALSSQGNAKASTQLFSVNNLDEKLTNASSEDIYGAYANASKEASSSVKTFYLSQSSQGSSANNNLYGAYAKGEQAQASLGEGNMSIINNSSLSGNVYGAYAQANDDATATTQGIFLGTSSAGSDEKNDFIGSSATSDFGAAQAFTDFMAIYDGSSVNATIKGSFAQADYGDAKATTNIFSISNKSGSDAKDNSLNKDAYGAYAQGDQAEALVGTVYIANSSISNNAYNNNFTGAFAQGDSQASATLDNNFSIMQGSIIDGNITAAYANSSDGTAIAKAGDLFHVSSTLGNANDETFLYGAYAQAAKDATASTATFRFLNGIEINSNLYGAYASSSNGNTSASNGLFSMNNIQGNTDKNIHNGDIYSSFAQADNGTASATSGDFYLSNAQIGNTAANSVAGAWANSKGNASALFQDADKSFSILQSSVGGNIYGAYANSSDGTATSQVNNSYLNASSLGDKGDILVGAYAQASGQAKASTDYFAIYDGTAINASSSYSAYANSQNDAASASNKNFVLGNLNNKDKNSINGNFTVAQAQAQKTASASAGDIYLTNSTLAGDFSGAYASSSQGSATASVANPIQILDGTAIKGNLTGAKALASLDAKATADILISNSTLGTAPNSLGNVIAAYASSEQGSASGGSNITIYNSTIDGDITGTYASSPTKAEANNNTLTLQNATLYGNVYLGAIKGIGTANNNVLNIYSGNVISPVEIWGGYEDSKGKASSSNNLVKGNTLNYYAGANPLKVKKLRNFDTYNIETWGQGVKLFNNDKSSAFITVTDEIGNDSLTSNGTYQSTFYVFNSGITFADNETLKAGDKMYILNADGANIINGKVMDDAFVLGNNKINVGLIYQAGIYIGKDSDQTIYAEIQDLNGKPREDDPDKDIWHYIGGGSKDNTPNAGKQPEPSLPDQPDSPDKNKPDGGKNPVKPNPTNPDANLTLPDNPGNSVNPENPDAGMIIPVNPISPTNPPFTTDPEAVDRLKPVLEGRLAALMGVNGSFNAVIDDIWKKLELANKDDIIPFALLRGSHDRYNSGSHVKSNGFDLIAGSAYNITEHSLGGWFYEYGRGNYNTYNFFPAYDSFQALDFKAKGRLIHYGVGLLGKSYFHDDKLYFDGGVRYGRLKNRFETSSFTDGNYRAVNPNFTDRSNYFGAYAGTGYLANVDKKHNFDTSIKYLYNQITKSEVEIDKSTIKFDKVSSSRIKIAEDYKYETNKYLALTAGLAYEYEFNGKAKGSIDGHKIKSPKMKGSTGIGTLGVRLTPFKGGDKNKAIDFAVSGYTGKHEGVAGTINFQYNFQ